MWSQPFTSLGIPCVKSCSLYIIDMDILATYGNDIYIYFQLTSQYVETYSPMLRSLASHWYCVTCVWERAMSL